MARPPKKPEDRFRRLCLTLSPDTYKKLMALCSARIGSVPVSQVIAYLIEKESK